MFIILTYSSTLTPSFHDFGDIRTIVLVTVNPRMISDTHLFSAHQTEAKFTALSLAAEMARGGQAFSELSRISKPSVK